MTDENEDVRDSRNFVRYVVDPPIEASLGPVEALISDFAELGIRVRHGEPLRIGLQMPISFRLPGTPEPFKLLTKVLWSHFFESIGPGGPLHYESGLRIEDDQDKSRAALERLLETAAARPEADSLEKKKAKLEKKTRKRQEERKVRIIRQTRQVPNDQQLMIQQALRFLKAHPTEAQKWYQRGKFAHTGHKNLPHRDDVLAIWEYLERSVEIETIAWVLDRE